MKTQGYCPKCGSDDLEYYRTDLEDDVLAYRFWCRQCHCRAVEYYRLVYEDTEVLE